MFKTKFRDISEGFESSFDGYEVLKGEPGKDGVDGLTPFIGGNGNWWIGETDTGIKAQGDQGPKGDQGESGAKGEQGEPGVPGAQGEQGAKGEDGYTPQKGIDYWTPADVDSMESILRVKAANIGGFVPVTAPIFDSGADINKTTVTVSSVTSNDDGSHTVSFNQKEEMFDDGGFEQYHHGESIVPLNSFSKGENGWTGLNFGTYNTGILRAATVCSYDEGESHSGRNCIEVWGRYSSLCKSIKLKPYTEYTLSFWQRGIATSQFNNISVAAKAYDGDVIYKEVNGAYWCDTENARYQVLYNRGTPNLNDAVIQNTGVWQKFEINFTTRENEYVDIFIYFGDNSWNYFYFDDFSVTEALDEEFTASYGAGIEVPPEVAPGSVFYIERDNGRVFTRFEYASSFAIKELYKYTEQLNREAFEGLVKEIGDISSALDSIIAIQEILMGGKEITFTLTYSLELTPIRVTLKAEYGMTWGEWVESKYNTIGITNGNNLGEHRGTIYLEVTPVTLNGNRVYDTDLIVADAKYIVGGV